MRQHGAIWRRCRVRFPEAGDVNAHGRGGLTPLMIAAYGGHVPVVQALLAAHANANALNDD